MAQIALMFPDAASAQHRDNPTQNELLKTIERIESEKLLLDLATAGIAAIAAAQPASIVRSSMSLEPLRPDTS